MGCGQKTKKKQITESKAAEIHNNELLLFKKWKSDCCPWTNRATGRFLLGFSIVLFIKNHARTLFLILSYYNVVLRDLFLSNVLCARPFQDQLGSPDSYSLSPELDSSPQGGSTCSVLLLQVTEKWSRLIIVSTPEESEDFKKAIISGMSCKFHHQRQDSQSILQTIYVLCCCLVVKSCPTLCDPLDCSQPSFSTHGISQARTVEWAAVSISRGSSRPRDGTSISCISWIGRQILYCWVLNSGLIEVKWFRVANSLDTTLVRKTLN